MTVAAAGGLAMIVVPFHTDEPLDAAGLPGPADPLVVPLLHGDTPWERMALLYDEVAIVVAAEPGIPIVVSGDCTTSLGVLAGLQRHHLDLGVVWFDAHGDLNTAETTPSGYLGGMPLALATGRGDATVREGAGLTPIPDDRVVLVGARALDPGEADLLDRSSIVRAEVGEALSAAPDGPLYVHFDLDVLDPGVLPGLRYPEVGGCGLDELAGAVADLVATGRVAALGLACTWDPDQVDLVTTQRVVAAVLAGAGA